MQVLSPECFLLSRRSSKPPRRWEPWQWCCTGCKLSIGSSRTVSGHLVHTLLIIGLVPAAESQTPLWLYCRQAAAEDVDGGAPLAVVPDTRSLCSSYFPTGCVAGKTLQTPDGWSPGGGAAHGIRDGAGRLMRTILFSTDQVCCAGNRACSSASSSSLPSASGTLLSLTGILFSSAPSVFFVCCRLQPTQTIFTNCKYY
jgi:hypothetical protein